MYNLLKGAPHDFVWNKLWRTELLAGFRLPLDGAYADDMALSWRIYTRVRSVTGVRKQLYHYRQVKTSIAHVNNINLVNAGLKSKVSAVMDVLKCDEETARRELERISEESTIPMPMM